MDARMQAEMGYEDQSELTPIMKFYYGRSVFITGATGLIGKVLIEKLLRCCPGIGRLYLLVREKRGKTPEERIDKLFEVELFKDVKKILPDFKNKICLVVGDVTKERLGISDEDLDKLKANVSIAFHAAASIKFNDPLKIAIQNNLVSTKMFVALCHELPNIVSMVHVSTAYVYREDDGSVLEIVPKCKVTPKQLLDAAEWMDENSEKAVTDFLQENYKNTYLVTKALCEVAVDESRGDIPTAIVRPPYVSSTWKEPFPGWIDSFLGISGLLYAGSKGVLRTLHIEKGIKVNIIPLDIAVNTIIVSAWYVAMERPLSTFIVNCVMKYETLPDLHNLIARHVPEKPRKYALSHIFRYPEFTSYTKNFPYMVHSVIDEWIPALILDLLLYIFTGKTVLVKVYRKIHTMSDIFLKIAKLPWIYRLENYNAMMNRLSGKDQEIFFLDTDSFDWDEYIDDCLNGGRKYLVKEDPKTLPYARKKAKIWWLVTTVLKYCLILLMLYYFLPSSITSICLPSNGEENL